MKYTVLFNTIEIKDGQEPITFSKDFEFTNENPLLARRAAIAKAKELEQECINDGTYDSGKIADAKNYRNTKGYSIDIWLTDVDAEMLDQIGYDDDYKIQLLGEEDEYEALCGLDNEAKLYHNAKIKVKFVNFKYENDLVEWTPCVIAEDYDYLLNGSN